eukprot:GHVR01055336.1.p1 GENE.GHVR01055336.1~~GHVR01055336.1.p1  ORF type:complete len:179 (+),score=86.76 GHVR01055336.1:115-651(+)
MNFDCHNGGRHNESDVFNNNTYISSAQTEDIVYYYGVVEYPRECIDECVLSLSQSNYYYYNNIYNNNNIFDPSIFLRTRERLDDSAHVSVFRGERRNIRGKERERLRERLISGGGGCFISQKELETYFIHANMHDNNNNNNITNNNNNNNVNNNNNSNGYVNFGFTNSHTHTHTHTYT